MAASRARVWSALLDPAVLRFLTPGAAAIDQPDRDHYRAHLSFGIRKLRGNYQVDLHVSDPIPPDSLELRGTCRGLLGGGDATAQVELTDAGGGTHIAWRFRGTVSGLVALAGGPLLRTTSRLFVDRFFVQLARHLADPPAPPELPAPNRP